ncbi:MAG TPA: acetylxylan esterase [Steroidobacteraceae bacterium]|nr:acetylxylan esterase [Steroidobacteraceae bacterium]
MRLSAWLGAALLALQILGAAQAAPADAGAETRRAFLKIVERPKPALKHELEEKPTVNGIRKQHLWFQSDKTERVPGYLLLPKAAEFQGRRPVVIALHGTGGNKDDELVAGILWKAVNLGFIGVAIDGRFHGERTKAGSGTEEYIEAISTAFRTGEGHPFYYDTVWDVTRLIDYLVTRKDVDPKRIGLTGISKGGIETYLATAVDKRIAAAVPYIGVQSFKWALDNGQWRARVLTIEDAFTLSASLAGKSPRSADFAREFYAKIVPGIDGKFDGPAMLPLIAPRPLLVVNGDSDANTPIAGVRLAVRAAEPVYAAAKAADRLKLIVQEDTAHHVNSESVDAGIAWFVSYLKP